MRVILTALQIVLLCGWLHPASADRRVALVLGNGAYEHAAELPNPKNDATDVATALERMGYEVIAVSDLKKTELETAIRSFARRLEGADVGLFYYSGHGLQVAGVNYVVPVDARLTESDALDFELIRLEVVQRIMESAAKANVIFLDSCRNNPLARNLARALGTRSTGIRQGLAAAEAGAGTLISFSTQPGNVALDGTGRNSPFTAALLAQIYENKHDLSRLLVEVRKAVMGSTGNQQVPWEHSALTSVVYLGMQGAGPISRPKESMACSEVEPRLAALLRKQSYTRDHLESASVDFQLAVDTIRGACSKKDELIVGPVLKVVKCGNKGTYVEVGGDKGGAFMIIDQTDRLQGGAPTAKGQWMVGMAGAPYYCIASTAPMIVWSAKIARIVGTR